MRASILGIERQPAGFASRWGSYFLAGLVILLSCMCVFGQGPIENGPSEGAPPEGAFGTQFVTANALRAPEKAQRAIEKAAAAMKNNEVKEAEKQLAHALELYPDYAQALTLRAIWKMTSDRSESIKDLQHAIDVDPQFGVPYGVLASIFNDSRRYEDALAVIQRAMQLLPAAWQIHYEMARALCGKHRSVEALREVTDAMRRMSADKGVTPQSKAAVHYLRGALLLDQNEFAEARREFQMAIKAEPQGPIAATSNRIVARLESQDLR